MARTAISCITAAGSSAAPPIACCSSMMSVSRSLADGCHSWRSLRAVTSLEMPIMPSTWPLLLRYGLLVTRCVTVRPLTSIFSSNVSVRPSAIAARSCDTSLSATGPGKRA
jgi:hypothetical protein